MFHKAVTQVIYPPNLVQCLIVQAFFTIMDKQKTHKIQEKIDNPHTKKLDTMTIYNGMVKKLVVVSPSYSTVKKCVAEFNPGKTNIDAFARF